jgi:hypothetical protein
VTAASGEIWDIDGDGVSASEEYRVQAFDSSDNLLASTLSPEGTDDGDSSLDGQPWVFRFSRLSAGIARIEIDFIGTKTTGIGLAFNDFDALGAGNVPTLSGWSMIAMAGGLLVTGLFPIRRLRTRSLPSFPGNSSSGGSN